MLCMLAVPWRRTASYPSSTPTDRRGEGQANIEWLFALLGPSLGWCSLGRSRTADRQAIVDAKPRDAAHAIARTAKAKAANLHSVTAGAYLIVWRFSSF